MESFGRLVDEARQRKGWGLNRLTVELGTVEGQILNATQLKRLFDGERRYLAPKWVQRCIERLDLDPAEAWAAAGLLPPGTDAEALRRTGLVATAGSAAEQARASMPPDSAPAGERRWGTERRRRRCPVRPLRLVPMPLPELAPGRWAA